MDKYLCRLLFNKPDGCVSSNDVRESLLHRAHITRSFEKALRDSQSRCASMQMKIVIVGYPTDRALFYGQLNLSGHSLSSQFNQRCEYKLSILESPPNMHDDDDETGAETTESLESPHSRILKTSSAYFPYLHQIFDAPLMTDETKCVIGTSDLVVFMMLWKCYEKWNISRERLDDVVEQLRPHQVLIIGGIFAGDSNGCDHWKCLTRMIRSLGGVDRPPLGRIAGEWRLCCLHAGDSETDKFIAMTEWITYDLLVMNRR